MKGISRVVEVKEGKKYVESMRQTDPATVYEYLSKELIAKKINQCTYIRSIKRQNNYDGTQNITVTYDNNVRAIYTITD